ncbi:MAG TPA: hypothetical protein VNG29_00675 [Candidatus Paceibacterota bacterium]|nr:hypothetical protein [Candidatus Paceibacterota bacterium]
MSIPKRGMNRNVDMTDILACIARSKDTLHTKVIKAGKGWNIRKASPGKSVHQTRLRAGKWIPERDIRILHILIAEQSEIALYVDIEVSLNPCMLRADRDEQLFRYKYAGPAVQWDAPLRAQYAGSNTTNSVIDLAPGIVVKKGTPIYVHLDVINWSPIGIKGMLQDVTLYFLEE